MSNKFTWSYQAFCEECGSEMVAHKINGHDSPTMCSVQIFLHCPKCASHLTPLALDGGDSSVYPLCRANRLGRKACPKKPRVSRATKLLDMRSLRNRLLRTT